MKLQKNISIFRTSNSSNHLKQSLQKKTIMKQALKAGKKVRLNRVSNSQPPGYESDTLTTEPPGQKSFDLEPRLCVNPLPDDTISPLSKVKAFADEKLNVTQTLSLLFIGYKTLWENKKMLAKIIFPFPTMFSKDPFLREVRSRILVKKRFTTCM